MAVSSSRGGALLLVRCFEPTDQDRAMELFKSGLFEYAIEGSIVAMMEESFFRSSSEGDMKDIQSYYIDHVDRSFFVAAIQGRVIGIVGAVLNEDKTSVELQRMSVANNSRGKGAGSKLVSAVIDFAKEKGVSCVKLETLDRKVAAIRLYERHGFEQVSSFQIPCSSSKRDFDVDTDEVVNVLGFELRFPVELL